MIYQIIYISSAKPELDDFALREIAHVASLNNQENGITGLLLFHDGTIMQVLEGDKASVQSLYEKIKEDPRHSGCMILSESDKNAREFSNWFMGYKKASTLEGADALFALTPDTLKAVLPETPSPEISTLTSIYARVNGI